MNEADLSVSSSKLHVALAYLSNAGKENVTPL